MFVQDQMSLKVYDPELFQEFSATFEEEKTKEIIVKEKCRLEVIGEYRAPTAIELMGNKMQGKLNVQLKLDQMKN